MIGKEISHYRILEKLGEGGMGVVYKAQDTKLERTVALKFLSTELTKDEAARKRFIQEAKAASGMQHNNICTIHEINEIEDGQIFIAMDFYEGQTLKDKLDDGPLPEAEVLEIISQIAAGLNEAHENGIIHRDVKPANIFITSKNEVKILDFGLAKLSGRTQHTKTGTTLGTVDYMSPEQVQGLPVDHRTDIWSLGVILYEMLSGEKPFKGEFDQAVMYNIVNSEPEPAEKYLPDISPEMQQAINRALEKDPEDRYQDVRDLLIDLNRLLKSVPRISEPIKSDRKIIQRIALPVIFIGIILIAVIVYFSFFHQPELLTKQISVAVIDFEDGTNEDLDFLSDQLIHAMETSQLLDVLTRSRLFDILTQLNKQNINRIDEKIGREICQFAKVDAMLKGSINKLGMIYSVKVQAIDPFNDKYLFTAEERCQGQGEIFSMFDRLGEKIRIEFKEREDDIDSNSQNVAEANTYSLEVYRHYFIGQNLYLRGESEKAQYEYRKAIALDSTFGLAYYGLSFLRGGSVDKKALIMKAKKYIDKIPEREKYLVNAQYAVIDQSDENRHFKKYEILKEAEIKYPNDKEILYEIGKSTRDDRISEVYYNKVILLDPSYEPALKSLINVCLRLKKYEEARKHATSLANLNPIEGYKSLAYTLTLEGNPQAADSILKILIKNNPAEGYKESAFILALQNKYQEAAEAYHKVLEINPKDMGVLRRLPRLYRKMENWEQLYDFSKRWVFLSKNVHDYVEIAMNFALVGDISGGIKIFQEVIKKYPDRRLKIAGGLSALYNFSDLHLISESNLKSLIKDTNSPRRLKDLHTLLSWSLLYQGKYREALETLDKKIEILKDYQLSAEEVTQHYIKALIKQVGWNNPGEEWRNYVNTPSMWNSAMLFYFALEAENIELAQTIHEERLTFDATPESIVEFTTPIRQAALNSFSDCSKTISYADSLNKSLFYNDISANRMQFLIVTNYYKTKCLIKANQYDAAIKSLRVLQDIFTDFQGFRPLYYPKSFYLLGKIYEAKEDTTQAIQNYEKLLELWKNADEDLVVLVDTKKRLASLISTPIAGMTVKTMDWKRSKTIELEKIRSVD